MHSFNCSDLFSHYPEEKNNLDEKLCEEVSPILPDIRSDCQLITVCFQPQFIDSTQVDFRRALLPFFGPNQSLKTDVNISLSLRTQQCQNVCSVVVLVEWRKDISACSSFFLFNQSRLLFQRVTKVSTIQVKLFLSWCFSSTHISDTLTLFLVYLLRVLALMS